jgi:uncharacterized membrane protein
MRRYIVAYLAAIVVTVAMDFVWLSLAGARLYRPYLGDMLLDQPVLWAAAAFYLMYGVGIVVLAVAPALAGGDWTRAALLGAVLGIVAYGTYDFTNQATLKSWSTVITVCDMAWGSLLTAAAASAGYAAARRRR